MLVIRCRDEGGVSHPTSTAYRQFPGAADHIATGSGRIHTLPTELVLIRVITFDHPRPLWED